MGELLKNILCLRNDIDRLTELYNESVDASYVLAGKIADNKEDISTMTSEKKYIESYVRDFKCRKGLLFSFPIGILFSVPYFTNQVICNLYSLTFGSFILQISSSGAIAMTISVISACLLLRSDKFKNFLLKKYSGFNSMNDKLNNLNGEIQRKKEELANLDNKIENINNTINNNTILLERKREELNKLEEEYFNNLFTKSITNGTVYEVSKAGKKRTLTRGCEYY